MTENRKIQSGPPGARSSPRVHSLREIAIAYEGQDEQIVVKPPNLSKRGMFINTSRSFPEGAVLNLRFSLVLTGAEIQTRSEVRYCQPGVGVGVEFIGLPAEAMKMIEREIEMSDGEQLRARPRRRLGKTATRSAR
ncbi:MAG: PilZ domain-containing protein [Candidatus Acidiferrum sp.]